MEKYGNVKNNIYCLYNTMDFIKSHILLTIISYLSICFFAFSPSGWKPGSATIKPGNKLEYFEKVAK